MANPREEARVEAGRLKKKLVDLTVALEGLDREVTERAEHLEESKLQREQAEAALGDIRDRDVVALRPYRELAEAVEIARAVVETAQLNWVVSDGKAIKARRAIADMQELYQGLQKELAKPDKTVITFRL